MIAGHRAYPDSGSSGFSSLLARANAVANSATATGYDGSTDVMSMPEKFRSEGEIGNRNLSNIISRIQDEGPALELADDTVHLSGKKRTGEASNLTAPSVAHNKHIEKRGETTSRTVEQHRQTLAGINLESGHDSNQVAAKMKKNIWPQLMAILAIAVTVVMSFFVYTLITQADDIIDSLRHQGEQLRITADSQALPPDIQPLVTSLNQELLALKNEFQAIRADYRDAESRLSKKIPDDLADRLTKIGAKDGSDTALQGKLERIRDEIAEMKKVIKSVKGSAAAAPVEVVASPGDWIVNLASLSSKDKAQQAVTRLKDSGVVPVIQEVVVKGEKVYRLSVAGFDSRGEATIFINKARQELGFEGGWIRRG